ncbi:ankyrin repeat domain-containing protein [Myroides fluvii]|uniref:ankyrin repeat domain-containing protein n=1 Tax=Myroides fluvii TaxID=2572594 RepID=UPI00131AC7C8|nr:ankyrin repeat domain-containing protein [Myroides fluvii]
MIRRISSVLMLVFTLGLSTNLVASCSNNTNQDLEKEMNSTITKELFQAVAANNIQAVKEILTANTVNLNVKNSKGESPLMVATYNKYTAIALYLIEQGADVNAQDEILNSPFLYAGAEGNLEVVQKALAHGADFKVFNRYHGTALIPAAEKGHVEVVKVLVNTPNFPIDHVNRLGWTALMEAIVLSNGGAVHVEIVKALIDGGVDVNIPDHDGKTPLYHAKAKKYAAIIKLLEAAGAR